MGMRLSRKIDPTHYKRASQVEDDMVGPYLDAIATSLHTALDGWRFHRGSPDDVALALDAFNALWAVAEKRNGR